MRGEAVSTHYVGDCLRCPAVKHDAKGPATHMWAKRHANATGHEVLVETTRTVVHQPVIAPARVQKDPS